MARITKIEAAPGLTKQKKIRVAAYARVSTKSDEQLLSLETQKEHYDNYINANPEWEYAGLYYDEGISGTKVEKRDGLQALLKDCEDGKIDRVITKSISRFSRNTTDCLEMVRTLARLNIYLFFEKENLDTEHMSSELMLSIMSSIAGSESRSISENEKWSITKRYQNGTFIIGYPPYGYDNVDGKMVVIPEEAAIVKEIFAMTINGMGSYVIAKELNGRGLLTKKNKKWTSSSIKSLLHNEKYTGDVIFQKTYTDDNYNRHINYGEQNRYLYQNHHEAIVSHEVFEQAAAVMEQRAKEKSIEIGHEKYQNRYAFSGRILCGNCGAPFKRRQHYKPSGAYIAWACRTHLEDKKACSMMFIRDEDFKNAFIRMMRKLQAADTKMLKPFVAGLQGTNNKDRLHQVMDLEAAIEKNTDQQTVLVGLMSAGYLEPEIFHMEKNQLLLEADELSKEKELISKSINGDLTHLEEAKNLERFVAKKCKIEKYDDDMFLEYVDTITVNSREEIVFNLKCGLHLKERLVEE